MTHFSQISLIKEFAPFQLYIKMLQRTLFFNILKKFFKWMHTVQVHRLNGLNPLEKSPFWQQYLLKSQAKNEKSNTNVVWCALVTYSFGTFQSSIDAIKVDFACFFSMRIALTVSK